MDKKIKNEKSDGYIWINMNYTREQLNGKTISLRFPPEEGRVTDSPACSSRCGTIGVMTRADGMFAVSIELFQEFGNGISGLNLTE
jgi:hypothetical protein